MTFGTTARLVFNLRDANVDTLDKAIKAIDGIRYMGGATATTDVLTLVRKEVVKKAGFESDRVMIFITDGVQFGGSSQKNSRRTSQRRSL